MKVKGRGTLGPQAGLSLSEVLVALTILSLATLVAMFLYDAARKSFKKGENATEQQQAVRIAYDRMSSDVRLAGYNANPDGDPFREDEGIEAAYDTAVVLRADFDMEEPDGVDEDNETALAGGAHAVESIGNDEIVAYVLAKPDGTSSDTLTFDADVKDIPRDGVSETVQIPNVTLVQNAPPYTLYRVTLNRNAATWGAADFLTRTPLLDNVRSLTFRYFDASGPINPAFDLTSASEDIGGADAVAARRLRAGIRRIEIAVDGLTRDPDLTWEDPADANPATRQFRKFHLDGEITPRNLGKKGQQDLGWDTTPPSRPGAPTLIAGHCQVLVVQWPANPAIDHVAGYRVLWRPQNGHAPGSRSVAAQSVYLSGLENAIEYFVSVQAVDAAGNWSTPSEERAETLQNDNTPNPPGNIVASSSLAYSIRLTWGAIVENATSDPAADVRTPPAAIRDLEGYRILRGLSVDFDPPCPPTGPPGCHNSSVIVADEKATGSMTSPAWLDRTTVACRDYFYRVVAWDFCDANDDSGYEAPGEAQAQAPPAKPIGLAATASAGVVRVTWDPVSQDTAGNEIFIDEYDVERCDGGVNCVVLRSDGAAGSFEDVTPGGSPNYRVRARNDCAGTANEASDWSDSITPACSFSGQVEITSPKSGWIGGRANVRVSVVGGSDPYSSAILELRKIADGTVQSIPLIGAGPTWIHDWTPPGPGGYVLRAVVTNTALCPAAGSARVFVGQ